MKGMTDDRIPHNCAVEDRGRVDRLMRFAIVAPYKDGFPGHALLAAVAYRPHAELFAAASTMLVALKGLLPFLEDAETKMLVGDEGCVWAVEEVRAAIARATGGDHD